jgi:hypothetical protein
VEAPERRRGIGQALVAEAAKTIGSLGYRAAYIGCSRNLRDFYSGIGCKILEQAAGAERRSVLKLDLMAWLTMARPAYWRRGLLFDRR